MFPADRQLVCNSSMISPRAMDFSGLATCWVCSWFSICTVWVGKHAPRERCGWQESCTAVFHKKGIVWWRSPQKKLSLWPSFLYVCLLLANRPISLWKTPENSGLVLTSSFTLLFQRGWHCDPIAPRALSPYYHARYIVNCWRNLGTALHRLYYRHQCCHLPSPKSWCLV